MKNLILLTLSVLFLQCCLEKDDELPKAIPYKGNQLIMNGYYYQVTYNNEIYRPFIMYSNGILLDIGGYGNTMEEMDKYIMRNYVQDTWYKRNKYKWGVFFIEDNTIRIHSLSQDYPHRGRVQEGVILNDMTFKITKFSSGSRVKECNDTYHFRQFSPKPDSTNVYIK